MCDQETTLLPQLPGRKGIASGLLSGCHVMCGQETILSPYYYIYAVPQREELLYSGGGGDHVRTAGSHRTRAMSRVSKYCLEIEIVTTTGYTGAFIRKRVAT